MRRGFGLLVASGLMSAFAFASDLEAQVGQGGVVEAKPHLVSGSSRKPQVRGYVARRGGYSYSAEDVINTYGDSRTLYGGANNYRDPMLDRQTPFGPFDHGFFFDSGVGLRGGNSPYHH